ncbi:E3 ubiquitin-protein ligase Topors-like [Zootermopsis nevadensis]|uniref:Uncharacterized protein n=1 Tax=Zootermopsis nevadensis TaxID=136037 RepID=A0A067R249_ZOONE|nr:E3 ubiquitin-protein ligase Topors-like [Zootermopsis nevadensis]KDR17094.1 hypothetical protein L798_09065 [Zootermopsis nevadensis]
MEEPMSTRDSSLSLIGIRRNALPVDQASDSDTNNSSGSHSDTSPSSILQDLPASIGEQEDKPSQSNEDLNSSDDCVFVGYVKPRHQRTPEVITLLSSDLEADEGEEMELTQMTRTYSSDIFLSPASSPSGSENNIVQTPYLKRPHLKTLRSEF